MLIFHVLIITLLQGLTHAAGTESLRLISLGNRVSLSLIRLQYSHPLSQSLQEKSFLPYYLMRTFQQQQQGPSNLQLDFGSNIIIRQTHQLPQKGISLSTDRPVPQKLQFAVRGVFGISAKAFKQYHLHSATQDRVFSYFYSDPNDFLCSENIEEIFKLLPCRTYSGLLSLLSSEKMLTNKYLGIRFRYSKSASSHNYSLEFFLETDPNEPFSNIIYTRLQKCPFYDRSYILNGTIQTELPPNPILVFPNSKQYIQPNQVIDIDNVKLKPRIAGKWYGWNSTLFFQIETLSIFGKLQLLQRFQPCFHPLLAQIQVQGTQNYTTSFEQSVLKVQWTQQNTGKDRIKISIPYWKSMKNFEDYEIMGRGGIEFMSPLLIVSNGSQPAQYLWSPTLTDRVPEPDFSIPFHVITFTLGLGGYIWVSIWRNYFKGLGKPLKFSYDYKQQ